jgi:predicted SnoaL-like aldol condensation-catalyzing enzyme
MEIMSSLKQIMNFSKVGFDVFRFENGKIVEHWDVIEEIPSKDKWANTNGKF